MAKQFSNFFEKDVKITSFYGDRIINGKKDFHNGIDVGTPDRWNLRVPFRKDGVSAKYRVTYNKWRTYNCFLTGGKVKGLFVRLQNLSDAEGFEWEFIHLGSCEVKEGTNMKSGDFLAKTGNTGCSTAPHTHITLRIKGKVVDPLLYLDTYKKGKTTYLRFNTFEKPEPPKPETPCEQKLCECEKNNAVLQQMVIDRDNAIKYLEQQLDECQQNGHKLEQLAKTAQNQTEYYKVYLQDIEKEGVMVGLKLIGKYLYRLLTGRLKRE
jgi:hypothetical protein